MVVAAVTFLVFGVLFMGGFVWARGGFSGTARQGARARGLMVVFAVWGLVDATVLAMALGAGDSSMAVATGALVAVNAVLLWAVSRRVPRS
jgi:hypothetical protein